MLLYIGFIPPATAAKCIEQALKPGGRFVAEFGGKDNIKQVIAAINLVLNEPSHNPWYFPSIGEYTSLLEQQKLEVNYAALFSRPTKLEGEKGLANWLKMFAGDRFKHLSSNTKVDAIEQIESQLRPSLYKDSNWWADYCRIRIVATKPNNVEC